MILASGSDVASCTNETAVACFGNGRSNPKKLITLCVGE